MKEKLLKVLNVLNNILFASCVILWIALSIAIIYRVVEFGEYGIGVFIWNHSTPGVFEVGPLFVPEETKIENIGDVRKIVYEKVRAVEMIYIRFMEQIAVFILITYLSARYRKYTKRRLYQITTVP